jgi:hypothetical protein
MFAQCRNNSLGAIMKVCWQVTHFDRIGETIATQYFAQLANERTTRNDQRTFAR